MTLPWMAAKILLRPVAELRAHPGNARVHGSAQIEQIKASMLAFGFTNPLLVDEAGVLIAGHGRLEAAVALGIEKVPTIVLRHLEEHHKTAMLAGGDWRATAVAEDPHTVGFHISALYSPVGWLSWEQIARDWEAAQGKPEDLKTFKNTVLGETWQEQGEAPDWERLVERREDFRMGVVPAGALWRTRRCGRANFPAAGMSRRRRRRRRPRTTPIARVAGSRRATAGFAEGRTRMDPTVLAWALAQPAGSRAATLAAAYTGGTKRVTFDGRTVEYRILDELGRALAVLRSARRRRRAGRA